MICNNLTLKNLIKAIYIKIIFRNYCKQPKLSTMILKTLKKKFIVFIVSKSFKKPKKNISHHQIVRVIDWIFNYYWG